MILYMNEYGLIDFLNNNAISYLSNKSMKEYTTFKIGGNAKYIIFPDNIDKVALLVKYFNNQDINYMTLGKGSNILFNDDELKRVIIKTDKLDKITAENGIIYSDSGISLANLTMYAYSNGLSGLEFLFGIPGSVGGAVYMNAGAYGKIMSDVVIKTTFVNENGDIKTINNEEHKYGYRKSVFTDKDIICNSSFSVCNQNKDIIKAKMDELMLKRKTSQPLEYPSAGSVFKRPEGYFAGKLIEDSGLKGYSIGGAEVSEKHAGFIINKNNASAKEVIALINHIKNVVYEKYNVVLETEIKIIN
ncbi:MAG: UDP-N-acetylenolpyruvoylglucosamine reductase [Clostridia bacterium]|nr:UDP-N-acetylenolpyruvoylglucosamine reductase [Clostridia bacterium]